MAGLKSYFPSSLYAPTATMAAFKAQTAPAAPSAPSGFVHPASAGFTAHSQKEYGLDYFLKGALAGGICCSVTHGALTPVDVVKTRMQLDPTKYTAWCQGSRRSLRREGAGALLTGLGPTAFGYFIQGWFKFGGVEFFKIQAAKSLPAGDLGQPQLHLSRLLRRRGVHRRHLSLPPRGDSHPPRLEPFLRRLHVGRHG